jgi:tRNA(Arg) A34 adenosine deaminase TadA
MKSKQGTMKGDETVSEAVRGFMREALDLAVENVRAGQGGPFAALVVKGGCVIARGTNRVTTANDPTAHAEVEAIREACRALESFQLEGCDLYTTCEPCPMCMGAIYWARPARVYYAASRQDAAAAGFDDEYIYEELALPPEQRRLAMHAVLSGEAHRPFRAWADADERTGY